MSRESARSLRLRDELSLGDPNGSKWTGLNLTNTIRDNQSVVPATGNHGAYNMKGIKDDLLEDPNTAYTCHVYAGHDENKPARWVQALDGPEEVRPGLVTEWGFRPRTNEHFRGTAHVRERVPYPVPGGKGCAPRGAGARTTARRCSSAT